VETTEDIKTCCATLYKSDWARIFLGDSFHPGGLALTRRLGTLLDLKPGQRVLDVAAGPGSSAIFLAQQFGCDVAGLDYSADLVNQATAHAEEAGLGHLVRFQQGDAEQLRFAAASFDALICECAFCTFPDKTAAAREFVRVLKPGGKLGLSDLTRSGEPLPEALEGLLAWLACIADARPVAEYEAFFEEAGLQVRQLESHNAALEEMVKSVQTRLLGAEFFVRLKNLDLPGVDFKEAKLMARASVEAVRQGQLGYVLLVATRPFD
jgi:ubiquinone/menaquinone biosynthesis C-methylase UbiE